MTSSKKRFFITAVIVALFLASLFVCIQWAGLVEVQKKVVDIPLYRINEYDGHAFSIRADEWQAMADTAQDSAASKLLLLEDGDPLPSPHAMHADIIQIGEGRYSHWVDTIIFSSSDNTSPLSNGRKYSVSIAKPFPLLVKGLALVLLAVSGAWLAFALYRAQWPGEVRRRIVSTCNLNTMKKAIRSDAVRYLSTIVVLVVFLGSLVLCMKWLGVIEAERDVVDIPTSRIAPYGGHAFSFRADEWQAMGDSAQDSEASKLLLLEDGDPLPSPHAMHADIIQIGEGRYSHWVDTIIFSSSDNTSPVNSQRQYSVSVPKFLPLWVNATALVLFIISGCWLCYAFYHATWPKELPRLIASMVHPDAIKKIMSSGVKRHVVIVAAWALLLPSLTVVMHSAGFIAIERTVVDVPSSHIVAHDGHAYSFDSGKWQVVADTSGSSRASLLILLEDGRPLPGPHAMHSQIIGVGGGGYSHWYNTVIFSSSDNSSPLDNKRQYSVSIPKPFSPLVTGVATVLLLATGILLCLIRYYYPAPFSVLLPLLLVTAVFALSPVAYYFNYDLPIITYDSASYVGPSTQIIEGYLPQIGYRTLAYPLLLAIVAFVHDTYGAVLLVQFVLSLGAALLFVHAAFRLMPKLVYPAALCVIAVQLGGGATMDNSIMSDNVFTSMFTLFFALLLFYLKNNEKKYLWLASVGGAMVLLTRPTGVVIFPLMGFILLYLLANKKPWHDILRLLSFPVIVMLLVMTYNYVTIDTFRYTKGDSKTWAFTTAALMEQDDSYPPKWNKAIQEIQDYITPESRDAVLNSWDYDEFFPAYNKAIEIRKIWVPLEDADDAWPEKDVFDVVTRDAFKKHTSVYFKIFLFNAYNMFILRTTEDFPYSWNAEIAYRIFIKEDEAFGPRVPSRSLYFKEYYDVRSLPGFYEVRPGKYLLWSESWASSCRNALKYVRAFVFEVKIWPILGLCVYPFLCYFLVVSRFRNSTLFASFLMLSTWIGHNAMISLFTYGVVRMSLPTLLFLYAGICFFVAGVWSHYADSRKGLQSNSADSTGV